MSQFALLSHDSINVSKMSLSLGSDRRLSRYLFVSLNLLINDIALSDAREIRRTFAS